MQVVKFREPKETSSHKPLPEGLYLELSRRVIWHYCSCAKKRASQKLIGATAHDLAIRFLIGCYPDTFASLSGSEYALS